MNTIPEEQLQSLRAMQSPLMAKDATLRDLFAGMALQGVMVNAQGLGEMDAEQRARLLNQVAGLLYETSDAMLAARKEKP